MRGGKLGGVGELGGKFGLDGGGKGSLKAFSWSYRSCSYVVGVYASQKADLTGLLFIITWNSADHGSPS
jgi:hypothetical protein